jgi:DNA-binding response OmpR family regulator
VCTILLVDDAPDIRLLLRAVLQRAGHEVVEAESGTAALTALDDGLAPDAVILDIQMPGLDGWDTLARMRQHPNGLDLPVLMVSVKASPQDMSRAWELGCDGYITKPFDIGDLAGEVQAIASMSPGERAAVRRARLDAVLEQSRQLSH